MGARFESAQAAAGMVALFASLVGCRPTAAARDADQLEDAPTEPPRRSAEAQRLLQRLEKLSSDDAFALGHQDATAYGVDWKWDEDRSDVASICGSHPGVLGFDLGRKGETNLDGVPFDLMRRRIEEGHARGSIITVSWHLGNPVSGGDAWDTKTAVRHLLPGGSHHQVFRAELARAAAFLNGCRTREGAKVPVVFRPLHEHNGSWFWWGADHASSAEYVRLFRFIVEYLRDEAQAEQLLFAISPSGSKIAEGADVLYRYPGDWYVDVIGFDHYFGNDGRDFARIAELVVDVALSRKKIPAVTEFGLLGSYGEPSVDPAGWLSGQFLQPLAASDKARRIAYALAWRNEGWKHFFLPSPASPWAAELRGVCESPFVLLQNDLAR